MLNNNLLALVVTLILCVIWLRSIDLIAQRGWITGRLSRKIIHTGTGPIFSLCWLLFNNTAEARYLAALIPFLITVQFALVGLGIIKDEAAVQAMSRRGDRREILRGPLIYGIVFVIVTIWFWVDSPIGIVALMILCGGDGLADIFGRGIRSSPLPWNPNKSWAGSAGMLLGGWVFSFVLIGVYIAGGLFSAPLSAYIWPISLISILCAVVESLPLTDFDNLTVTATAVLFGYWLF
jgi:phytol kinase